jgi:uncharacterized protein involved in exopolysaccharide biosynthesis
MNVIAIRKPAGEMNLPPEDGGELGTFSLKWIFEFLVRRWMLIAAVGAVAFALAFTVFMVQPPQYSATALVMMSGGGEQMQGPQTPNGRPDAPASGPVVDSQLEVLRSDMLTGRLVDALGLMNDAEWNGALEDPDAPAATDQSPAAQAYRAEARQAVVKAVSGAITVRRRGLTYAAEVSATSQSWPITWLNFSSVIKLKRASRALRGPTRGCRRVLRNSAPTSKPRKVRSSNTAPPLAWCRRKASS